MKLTQAQTRVLTTMLAQGGTSHSGRGGWSLQTFLALERMGLVSKGRVYTWETDWHLTAVGRGTARRLRNPDCGDGPSSGSS